MKKKKNNMLWTEYKGTPKAIKKLQKPRENFRFFKYILTDKIAKVNIHGTVFYFNWVHRTWTPVGNIRHGVHNNREWIELTEKELFMEML